MKKALSLILAVIILCCTLASCQGGGNDNVKSIVDLNGDTVTIPANPSKIICRSGNGTSFLMGMGYSDKIIGTADYMIPNPWIDLFAPSVSNVAEFGWDPSTEELYAMGADLIMFPDGNLTTSLREMGLTAVCYKQYNEQELLESVELLKDIFSEDEEAQAYLSSWQQYYNDTISYLNEKISTVPLDGRPVVHYIYAASNKGPNRTVGGGGIYSSWLEHSGAILASQSYPADTFDMNEEEIFEIDPDFILIGGLCEGVVYEELMENEAWSNVSAVKEGNVHVMPISTSPWDTYGIEYPLWILWTAKTLYPELIDKNIIDETRNFYKEFFDVELTNDQINNMLNGLAPDGSIIKK